VGYAEHAENVRMLTALPNVVLHQGDKPLFAVA
jgi:hypothetical protein